MIIRTGFFCSTWDNILTTNRKIKLLSLSHKRVIETFLKNLNDLKLLLELCKNNGFEVFRIGSNFVPFFSHKDFKDKWRYEIEDILKSERKNITKYNIRLTMHPGQFVVLNSPNPKVISESVREIEYHSFILDSLETDQNSVIIIHTGGKYQDKQQSIERFVKNVEKNVSLKKRIAIENDDKSFSAYDVLQISKFTGLPVVFDYYHHLLNPSEFDLYDLIKTWVNKIPKFHISSAGKRKYEHSDYLDRADFDEFKKLMFSLINTDIVIDVMPEVKMKEKAALIFLEWIK
ncbi:MAG: UV DNA damage repair endonuclease UvsE [bacterium]|nr:UV DNA damage repair endonuclease UvsE [bacterium]